VIDEVRARADLVQIVGRHLTLRRSGSRYWARCPFHSEKTPSFQVQPDRQVFYCFGCGAGGDLFAFRMRAEGITFPEAVRATAREVGVEVPEEGEAGGGQREDLGRANEAALAFFREALRGREGARARRYLEGRGIPAELVDRFEIGYAPPGWEGLAQALGRSGITHAAAEAAGLLAPRQTREGYYDRFRDRVVFPIRDASRRVLGFGGRALDPDAPKYLNTPETPLYRKGQVLFGLPQALEQLRDRDRAVVVEGYFDVLGLARAGLREGLAPCGTALTVEHARRLRRYVSEVILLFDGDEAGARAAERALPLLLAEGLRVRAAFLPPGEDPDSLASREGGASLRETVERAEPLLDHLMEKALRRHRGHAWSAADAVRSVAEPLMAIPDPVESESYTRTLASRLGLSVAAVREALELRAARRAEAEPPGGVRSRPEVHVEPTLRTLIGLVAAHPGLAHRVTESDLESLPSTEAREILERVLEAARGHGAGAIARLLSPAEDRLGPEAKEALLRIESGTVPLDGGPAEQALRDCLARLGATALERESRQINAQLETCDDPGRLLALLEAKQEAIRKRRALFE
jgi:DNA primase